MGAASHQETSGSATVAGAFTAAVLRAKDGRQRALQEGKSCQGRWNCSPVCEQVYNIPDPGRDCARLQAVARVLSRDHDHSPGATTAAFGGYAGLSVVGSSAVVRSDTEHNRPRCDNSRESSGRQLTVLLHLHRKHFPGLILWPLWTSTALLHKHSILICMIAYPRSHDTSNAAWLACCIKQTAGT